MELNPDQAQAWMNMGGIQHIKVGNNSLACELGFPLVFSLSSLLKGWETITNLLFELFEYPKHNCLKVKLAQFMFTLYYLDIQHHEAILKTNLYKLDPMILS